MNVFPFPFSSKTEFSPSEFSAYAEQLSSLPQNCPHCLKCEVSYKSISKFLEDMNKDAFACKIEFKPSEPLHEFNEIDMFGISFEDLKEHRYA